MELDLAPITIIYGLNGSGKSSLLQGIQFLKQSLSGSLGYDGLIYFKDFTNLVRMHDDESEIEISLSIPQNDRISIEIGKTLSDYGLSNIQKMRHLKNKTLDYTIRFNSEQTTQRLSLGNRMLFSVRYSGKEPSKFLFPYGLPDILIPNNANNILSASAFTSYSITDDIRTADDNARARADEFKRWAPVVNVITQAIRNSLEKYYLLMVQRGNIPWSVSTGGTPKEVGIHGETLVQLLAYVFGKPEFFDIGQKIKKWASEFGLSNLQAAWVGKDRLEAWYTDPEQGTPVNLSLAGHGSKQILSVIVQLFFSDEGSVLCIEEPEMSLHKALLPELIKLFAEAKKENKQIIITTHNDALPSILKRCIPKILSANDIAVYELQKKSDGTTSEKLEVREDGVIENFIPSIRKAEEKIYDLETEKEE